MIPKHPTMPSVGANVPHRRSSFVPGDPALLWSNVAGTANGTDVVLPVDATADGKRMFAVLSYRGAGVGFSNAAWGSPIVDQTRGASGRLQIFTKIASSEPASYTFTSPTTSTHAVIGGAFDAVVGLEAVAQEGASSVSHVAPDAIPLGAPSVVLRVATYAIATDSSTPSYTWPAGTTELEDISQASGLGTGSVRLTLGIRDGDHPDTSAVGAVTATAVSAGVWAAATIIARAS